MERKSYPTTQPSEGLGGVIALAEGWANFMQHITILEFYAENFNYYSDTDTIRNIRESYEVMENFEMRPIPFEEAIRPTTNADGDPILEGWFLAGLFWDLYDDNDDEVFRGDAGENSENLNTGDIIENVEGDIGLIFELLQSDIRIPEHLEETINTTYPVIEDRVTHLFNLYGY